MDDASTPGARLEAERRRQGLHLVAMAVQLKVPPARLAAVEGNRWSELPDATHARALATAMCRILGLNPAEVLVGMPRGEGPGLERVSAGLNRPFEPDATRRRLAARGAALLVLGLLGAGLAWWMHEPWLSPAAPQALFGQGAGTLPLPPDGVALAPVAVPVSATNALQPVLPASAAPKVVAAPSAPSASAPWAVIASTPEPTDAVTERSTVTATPPELTLRAEGGRSWVRVLDAGGAVALARELAQGETVRLTAQPPLRVTLGNASAVRLDWRGHAQETGGADAPRVAHLELK